MPTLAAFGLLFDQPVWLLAIVPAIGAIVAIALRAGSGWRSQPVSLSLRLGSVTLLVVALARPIATWHGQDVAVVVVRDVSASVPKRLDGVIDQFLATETRAIQASDRIGVIAAAATPSIVRASLAATPAEAQSATAARAQPGQARDGTDLGAAIHLALSSLPHDAGGRVVLVSDGFDLAGEFDGAVASAQAAGVPIDVVPLDVGERAPVIVESVQLPDVVRPGAIVPLRVTIDSRESLDGWLSVRRNGLREALGADGLRIPIAIGRGRATFVLNAPAPTFGACRYDVRVEISHPRSDPELESGSAIAFTSGKARVAVVSNASRAHELVRALEGSDVEITELTPGLLGTTALDLAQWDAIALCDFGVADTNRSGEDALIGYVRDLGGGLMTIGGPNAYGAGGWIGSRFAEILPLELDPPPERMVPSSGLAIVIDRSGSMSRPIQGVGRSQLALAADAAIAAVRALGRDQYVTVIGFDAASDVIVPLTANANPEAVGRAIASLGSGGDTDLFPAIALARQELARRPLGSRHVLVLSDGETAGSPDVGVALAHSLAAEGTTLSTIAVGDAPNTTLMGDLARAGMGRSWTVDSRNAATSLTPIFQRETFFAKRSLLAEDEAFRPVATSTLLPLAGIRDPLPEMKGYVVTAPRRGLATLDAESPQGDPILAHWNHGLGRVYSWTGDAAPRWDRGWLASDAYATLWRHLLKRVLRPADDGTLVLHVNPGPTETLIALSLRGEYTPSANASLVRIVDASGAVRTVELERISLTEFVGRTSPLPTGAAIVQAAVDDGNSVRTIRRGLVVRDDRERRAEGSDLARLSRAADATGGRVLALDAPGTDLWSRDHVRMPTAQMSIWDLLTVIAAALFVADTAARRLALRRERIVEAAAAAFIPAAVVRETDARAAPGGAAAEGLSDAASAAVAESQSLRRLRAAKERARGATE
ncbi:MAG: VWA domain-containing protein [Phycisphaerales bacterium]